MVLSYIQTRRVERLFASGHLVVKKISGNKLFGLTADRV